MSWRIGLDEAGYGPNLGPLVLASTACHVPDSAPESLWKLLESCVRKREDADSGRLLIDDSKKVNEGRHGFRKLETGVHAVLASRLSETNPLGSPESLHTFLSSAALGSSIEDLHREPWFDADFSLPVVAELAKITEIASLLADATRVAELVWGPICLVIIPTPKYNRLLDVWTVKSGVLATGVIALLSAVLDLPGDDPVDIAVDKLGGRHFYAPLINEAFPDGWTRVVREGPDLCEYIVYGLRREVRLRFEPRADGAHLNVALASMAAKYLREVCMLQFNRYWQSKVPGLKATAGYPVDAARYFRDIQAAMAADGVAQRDVWRAK